jgi:hypothetical protein
MCKHAAAHAQHLTLGLTTWKLPPPALKSNLMKILQAHKFEEGGEADDDDSELPHGMTIIDTNEIATLPERCFHPNGSNFCY